jgi:hypothetical protein
VRHMDRAIDAISYLFQFGSDAASYRPGRCQTCCTAHRQQGDLRAKTCQCQFDAALILNLDAASGNACGEPSASALHSHKLSNCEWCSTALDILTPRIWALSRGYTLHSDTHCLLSLCCPAILFALLSTPTRLSGRVACLVSILDRRKHSHTFDSAVNPTSAARCT